MPNPNEYEELFGVNGDDYDDGESADKSGADGENEREEAAPGIGRTPAEDEETREEYETGDAADGCFDNKNGGSADDFENADKKTQSMEERARFAAARRRAELEEAVLRARHEEQDTAKTKWNEFFAAAGLRNPLDGNTPITNLEEYTEYKAQYEARLQGKNLHLDNMAQEPEKAVYETETMKTDRQASERTDKEDKLTREERFNAKMREELKTIGELDPTVGSVEDILKSSKGREFYSLVQSGHSYVDAFKLANFERIRESGKAAAQQQALNRAMSKDHLVSSSQRGAGSVLVPADVMAQYKYLLPNASEAEIQKHYNNQLKK